MFIIGSSWPAWLGLIALRCHTLGYFGPIAKLRSQASTPAKRIGFILLVIGIPVFLIGVLALMTWAGDASEFFTYWMESLALGFGNRSWYSSGKMISIGTWIVAAGSACWWYDSTIARLVSWIRVGTS